MYNEAEKKYWEHFQHKADIGIRGVGFDKQQAFEQAAVALTAVITEPEKVKPERKIKITCQADNDEMLFIDWLSCLIYEMATQKMLFSRFEVSIKDKHLKASVWGQKVDIKKHRPAVEIKGATYTALSVKQIEDGRWIAQCVVDV